MLNSATKSGTIANDVLFGEDGWMFLWQGNLRQFDHLTGVLSPSRSSIAEFSRNVEQRSSICNDVGLPYVHVVYPSKPTVMTTMVPQDCRVNLQNLFERHYARSLSNEAKKHLPYPRKGLVNKRHKRQVLSRHDTHMTSTGNALVSREILLVLGYSHDPFSCMREETRPRRGDLANMASIQGIYLETPLVAEMPSGQIIDNRAPLPGNTDNIAIAHNPNSCSSLRLLAIGDSLLRDGLTYLSTFFRDILYVRSDVFPPDLLRSFSPDVVVTANADRYLAKIRPDHNGEIVLMRGYGRVGYQPSSYFVSALRAQLSFSSCPSRYQDWAASQKALTFVGLGTAQYNDQLVALSGQLGWFEATGPDPIIIFSNVKMGKEKHYRLRVVMESTVRGSAQLFIGRCSAAKHRFLESDSSRQQAMTGKNVLEFDIPPTGRGRELRFDPINCLGKAKILSMEIRPADFFQDFH